MVKCPNCKKELTKPKKSWSYGQFAVQAYSCSCGTRFREYTKDGKHSFMLKLRKGKGFVSARDSVKEAKRHDGARALLDT